eukprot:scaffold7485_cov176-Amphora_coffeaeformis.AAC.5
MLNFAEQTGSGAVIVYILEYTLLRQTIALQYYHSMVGVVDNRRKDEVPEDFGGWPGFLTNGGLEIQPVNQRQKRLNCDVFSCNHAVPPSA